METVMVNASSAYPVHIGGGLLDRCGGLLAAVTSSRRCAVVTDSTVGPLYAGRVRASLEEAGFTPCCTPSPPGSRTKIWPSTGILWNFSPGTA